MVNQHLEQAAQWSSAKNVIRIISTLFVLITCWWVITGGLYVRNSNELCATVQADFHESPYSSWQSLSSSSFITITIICHPCCDTHPMMYLAGIGALHEHLVEIYYLCPAPMSTPVHWSVPSKGRYYTLCPFNITFHCTRRSALEHHVMTCSLPITLPSSCKAAGQYGPIISLNSPPNSAALAKKNTLYKRPLLLNRSWVLGL